MDHRPVAFVEISDALGPRRDGKSVRAEVVFPIAVADRQWRALARAVSGQGGRETGKR